MEYSSWVYMNNIISVKHYKYFVTSKGSILSNCNNSMPWKYEYFNPINPRKVDTIKICCLRAPMIVYLTPCSHTQLTGSIDVMNTRTVMKVRLPKDRYPDLLARLYSDKAQLYLKRRHFLWLISDTWYLEEGSSINIIFHYIK